MSGVLRYTIARMWRGQHWLAPCATHLLLGVVLTPPNTPVLASTALGLISLLPVGAWLTASVLNTESRSQQLLSATQHGGILRYRAHLVGVAAAAAVALGVAGNVVAFVRDPSVIGSEHLPSVLLAVVAADVTVASLSVTIGVLSARPILARPGIGVLIGLMSCVLLLTVPLSPMRAVIGALSSVNAPTAAASASAVAVPLCALSCAVLLLVGRLRDL